MSKAAIKKMGLTLAELMTWDSHQKATANWERTQRKVWGDQGVYDPADYKKVKQGDGDDMINVDSTVTQHHHHYEQPKKSSILPKLAMAGILAATGGTGVGAALTLGPPLIKWLTSGNAPAIINPVDDGSSTSFIELE